jgi:hypothetical protein
MTALMDEALLPPHPFQGFSATSLMFDKECQDLSALLPVPPGEDYPTSFAEFDRVSVRHYFFVFPIFPRIAPYYHPHYMF